MCCYLLCFVGASVIDWGRCHINYSNVMIGFLIGNTLWQMRNPRRRQLSQIWGFHIIYFTIKILHLQMIVNWVRNERCSSRNLFSLLFNSSPYETEMASINILWTLLNIVCFFFFIHLLIWAHNTMPSTGCPTAPTILRKHHLRNVSNFHLLTQHLNYCNLFEGYQYKLLILVENILWN